VARDRDSQAVQLIQEDLTNEIDPRLLEVAKDGESYFLPT
jgi:hypothetical protein